MQRDERMNALNQLANQAMSLIQKAHQLIDTDPEKARLLVELARGYQGQALTYSTLTWQTTDTNVKALVHDLELS
jgi:hypothetical protein